MFQNETISDYLLVNNAPIQDVGWKNTAMKSTDQISRQRIGRFVALVCVFFAVFARAHELSESYFSLTLDSDRFTGRLDIALRDMQSVVPLVADEKGVRAGEQLALHDHDLTAYVLSHLQIRLDGRVLLPKFEKNTPVLEELSGRRYLQLNFILEHFPPPRTLEIAYRLFFETNSLHRGLLRLEAEGKTQMAAFSPRHSSQQFQFGPTPYGRQFLVFLREGVWHIWTGYDHILFLLALLLPAVLRREAGHWREVSALRPAFYNVVKIVSAFTIAHSLTLSLATFGLVRLPSRFTEAAIALSVILAAGNNLWPLVRERGWVVAFVFGLVHGFGFATALSDLGLTHGRLALALLGFNAGVEMGQLALVAVFLPVAFALRRTWLYQTPLLRLGSACVILIASAWCAERVLDVKFMPF
jgi:hypothetical protein